jgi:pilus assembly protein Flp/PilA
MDENLSEEIRIELNIFQPIEPNFKFIQSLKQGADLGTSEALEPRRHIMKFIRNMFKDNKGATAIEYGLIAALIAVAAITAMQGLGNNLKKTFNNVATNLNAA